MANHANINSGKKSVTAGSVDTSPIRERSSLKSLTAIRNLPIGKYQALKASEMMPRKEHMNVQKMALERLQEQANALKKEE